NDGRDERVFGVVERELDIGQSQHACFPADPVNTLLPPGSYRPAGAPFYSSAPAVFLAPHPVPSPRMPRNAYTKRNNPVHIWNGYVRFNSVFGLRTGVRIARRTFASRSEKRRDRTAAACVLA